MAFTNPTTLPADNGATLDLIIQEAADAGTVLLVVLGSNQPLEAKAVAAGGIPLRAAIVAPNRSDIAGTVSGLDGQQPDLATDQGFAVSTGSRICDRIKSGEVIDEVRVETAYTRAEVGDA